MVQVQVGYKYQFIFPLRPCSSLNMPNTSQTVISQRVRRKHMITTTAFSLVASRWRRGLVRLALAVCLGAVNAAAQAMVEYGGAVATAGASSAGAGKAASAQQPMRAAADAVAANRRALEVRAGKDAAKLMLRSAPNRAWVWIDGKEVGMTPLQLVVAPGIHKVEMKGRQMDFSRKQVDLHAKETREVLLTLEPLYPTHVEL